MKKSSLMTIGIVLAALGAIGIAVQNISWDRQETVVDVGPVEASTTVTETVDIPDAAAGGVLAAGIVLLTIGAVRKNG